MNENSLARTVSDRARSVPRAPRRPGTTTPADGSNPPALALIIAPALLAVCFR
jgi:hypothetical protein